MASTLLRNVNPKYYKHGRGEQFLHEVASFCHPEALDFFESGVDVNYVDGNGQNALFYVGRKLNIAAEDRRNKIRATYEKLLAKGVKLNVRDKNKNTVAHAIAESGDIDLLSCLPFLAENGLDVTIRNKYLRSPLAVALRKFKQDPKTKPLVLAYYRAAEKKYRELYPDNTWLGRLKKAAGNILRK